MQNRRGFVKATGLAIMAGPALLAESMLAAARVRAAAAVEPVGGKLFDIEKVANGVYAALARPQYMLNSNAFIIVNEDDVMVVDTHSKPSAASSLISQIKAEITPKPVRYIVNTHFHGDHVLGNHAYPTAFAQGVAILSSTATRDLINEQTKAWLRKHLDSIPKQVEDMRRRREKATEAQARAAFDRMIAEAEAYQKEMRGVALDLPTITFNNNLFVHKKERDIELSLLGLGHTSGDVIVNLPKEHVVITGDLAHGFLPYIGDGYPVEWPKTLDKLLLADFDKVAGGHGPTQKGKAQVTAFRNYLQELTAGVRKGIESGQPVEALQKEITPASLKSLQADGYGQQLRANYARFVFAAPDGPPEFETNFRGNIADIYKKLKANKINHG